MATDRRFGPGRLLLVLVSLTVTVLGGVRVLRLADATPPVAHVSASTTPRRAAVPLRSGVPVSIHVASVSSHYPQGLTARIVAHPLNPDRTLYVPADPTQVAWASDDAAPGSRRGTAILVSHINYVIDGRTVAGAFADLAEYARDAIGRIVSVRLADGRTLRYRIVSGHEYSKDDLAANPRLRRALYDQTHAFGRGTRRSGRLLLVSCGGAFDANTGEYEDNVFLFALPVR